jgi:enoyl-CoA hydratase/carnithine racemase
MAAIQQSPKATIAAVSGPAFGRGCSLALACDFRVVDDAATFCIPAARLSIVYGVVETRVLLEAVGLARAKEMLFSACRHGARRAAEIGLATHVAKENALAEAKALAEALAPNAPLSIAGAKLTLEALAHQPDAGALSKADEVASQAMDSADYAEGVSAFAEKRTPVFRGA